MEEEWWQEVLEFLTELSKLMMQKLACRIFCLLSYPWNYLLIVFGLYFDNEYLYTLIFLFQNVIPNIEKQTRKKTPI